MVSNPARQKLLKVLKAAVELVCAPAWAGVSNEDVELERVLIECGFVTPNAKVSRGAEAVEASDAGSPSARPFG